MYDAGMPSRPTAPVAALARAHSQKAKCASTPGRRLPLVRLHAKAVALAMGPLARMSAGVARSMIYQNAKSEGIKWRNILAVALLSLREEAKAQGRC